VSLDPRLAHWIDPGSDPAVTLTMEQKGSMAILAHTRLLPVCLPSNSADGNVRRLLLVPRRPGRRRVTIAPDGDLVSLQYQHTPCDGDGTPGDWKLDTGDMWASLKAAILQQ
jgi:hypothetical protein